MSLRYPLSVRDAQILNLVFDPEAQPRTENVKVDDSPTNVNSHPLQPKESRQLQSIESRAIRLAEQGFLEEAESELSQAIEQFPTEKPSLWNNRAQVKRLSHDVRGALDDIAQAIKLATPSRDTVPSTECRKVLLHAYAHRATIYMMAARGEIPELRGDESVERLEEYASHDFATAGQYGSDIARAMAVRTNPYAKMCGAIVQNALKKEMGYSA